MGKPAYGREFQSPAEVMEAWHNGEDFYSLRGYFSIRDREYIKKEFDYAVIQWAVGKEVVVR